MRFLSLLVVVAIIYVVVSKRNGPASSTEKAMKEADAVMATPYPPTYIAPTQPAPSSGGLRAPIDRTHSVLDQVKKNNASNGF